jgi:hypothetical protein
MLSNSARRGVGVRREGVIEHDTADGRYFTQTGKDQHRRGTAGQPLTGEMFTNRLRSRLVPIPDIDATRNQSVAVAE